MADVPGDGDVPVRRAEDLPQELARRRLAVRPGHRDERVLEDARAELELTPDRNPSEARLDNEHRRCRHAGALDEQLRPVEERDVVVVPELAVGADDTDATPLEHCERRLPRAREA
jgi:hypothetical protein